MMIMLMVVMLMNEISERFLKRLFHPHKKIVENDFGDDDYFKELFDDSKALKFVLYDVNQSDINLKECCKSKDGTCATMECPHNYRRYGDDIYEIIKDSE